MTREPIIFDRRTGELQNADPIEHAVVAALTLGSKIASLFAHRGYNMCANLIKAVIPRREIRIRLGDDAIFSFPFCDGYWSKLLNRRFEYEIELEELLRRSSSLPFTFIDCGANYGYWSVLASSNAFGGHRAIAIEPSSNNFERLAHNAGINASRFSTIRAAIGPARGTARLSGNRHEALSIAGGDDGGETVAVLSLDDLVADALADSGGTFIVKLDVEGVEIAAMEGAASLLTADAIFVYEEHGNDPTHAVTRHVLERTSLRAYVFDPRTKRFVALANLAMLDGLKVARNVGYNIFATSSPLWEQRLGVLGQN